MSEPRVLSVSVTEIQQYLDCRRAWDFESANRQSLVGKGLPATALWVGSAVHAGLAAQIEGESVSKATEAYIEEQRRIAAAEYQSKYRTQMYTEEWEAFNENAQLVRDMLIGYFRYYGVKNTYRKYTPIASELTFRIPFPHIAQESTFYDEVWVVGTIDGALLDDQGNLGIVDHKTFSTKPRLQDLQLDHQFVGYCACMSVLINKLVRFFLYNGISKTVPKQPAVLKSGRLSREWSTAVNADAYVRAIIANNEDPDDPYYADFLVRLRARDEQENEFFIRHPIVVSEHAQRSWIANAEIALREMAQGPDLPLSYNRKWMGCWGCNVKDLCDAMIRGDDWEYLREMKYEVGTYGTQRRLITASPSEVSSLADLVEFAKVRKRDT